MVSSVIFVHSVLFSAIALLKVGSRALYYWCVTAP